MPEKSSGRTAYVQTKDSQMIKITENDRTETDDKSKAKQETLASVLPEITDALSKMNSEESIENGIPDISQSVTKLNGGNLVITTMTRKIEESTEEKEENRIDTMSGRASPSEGSEYGDLFLVQDSKGDIYVLEDLTAENDDSQESAYYSSSERHASESSLIHENFSTGSESPRSQRVHNLRAVGESSIDYSTAEDVILRMYEDNANSSSSMAMQTNGYATPRYPGYTSDKESYRNECSFNVSDLIPANTMSTLASTYNTVDYGSGVASQVSTLPHPVNDMESVSSLSENDNYVRKQYRTQTTDGGNKTSATYIVETSATLDPQPPIQPQYRVVKFDMTPEPPKKEPPQETEQYKVVKSGPSESPVYKSVAIIKGPDPKAPVVQDNQRAFKIITARASSATGQEIQNPNMALDQLDSREEIIRNRTTTNIQGYMSKRNLLDEFDASRKHQYSVERKPVAVHSVTERPRAPERVKHKTRIAVAQENMDNIERKRTEEQHSETTRNGSDMHVIHGSILIKNRIDHDETDAAYDDNINLFDNEFSLNKENPLYQSDEDMYKRIEREEEARKREQEALEKSISQDITFETVDKFTKSKQVKRDERPLKKQKLSELLLSRLSTIDSRDIRQHIDVKHHHEDIYGDPRFTHADGSYSDSDYTKNFDSVSENVYLTMKQGKAYITIKVTAERIMPIDIEFNVWRKTAAIVTREIEIDLSATEQRRRLYEHVMETSATSDGFGSGRRVQETVLTGSETLDVFSKIMDVAQGEGDHEDITVKTSQKKTSLPSDFFY